MMFKKIIAILAVVFLPSLMALAENIRTLGEDFSQFKTYGTTDKMEILIPLLKGETISFSDFKPNQDITMFEYEKPDTVWIKEKPKKNPKEGKHYILRNKYKGVSIEEGYYYKTTKEVTPVIELVGARFLVTGIDQIGETGYYSRPSFNVHLTNVTTGENIKWYIRPGASSFNDEYKVHLIGLNEKIGLVGKTLYSAKSDGYGNSKKFTNVTKHKCIGTDAIIDFTSYSPKFKILFTTLDENNRESSHSLPFSAPSSYSSDVVWFNESEAEAVSNSSRIYEIDYKVRLNADIDSTTLSFTYIVGNPNSYSVSVYQTLKPESYQSSDDYISSGDYILIGDRINVRGTSYYKAVCDGKAFFIPCSKVDLTPEGEHNIEILANSPQSVRDAFFEHAKAVSYVGRMSKLNDALNEIKSHAAKGISIPSWSVYDMSEYTDGTGVRFEFHNPTNKTIKYVNVAFVGYNAVDDRVGRVISKRCIGPIAPDETASYDFEYAWFTDVVEYAKMTSLSVQYKDGTTRTIAKPQSVVWSDDTQKALSSSRLNRLKSELAETE